MKYYIVDVFCDKVFGGNSTGVCVLEKPLDKIIMQKIATQNNLSETAFVLKTNTGYSLKWFTPKVEVDLCGHATLAAAFIVATYIDKNICKIVFSTNSGLLEVEKRDNFYEIALANFPLEKIKLSEKMIDVLGIVPKEAYLSRDLLFVLENEMQVKQISPNFSKMLEFTDGLGVIVTAKSVSADFVSRCFYPKLGVNEDFATASAHCIFAPFWSDRLNKTKLIARQISVRGAILHCELQGDTVKIGGLVALYLKGEVCI